MIIKFRDIINNLTTRIILLIFLTIISITTFFIIFGYYKQVELLEQKEGEKLMYLVTGLSTMIDGDMHQKMVNSNLKPYDIKSLDDNIEYNTIHKLLSKIQKENKLNSVIYTLVLDDDDGFFYGVRSDSFVDFRNRYELFPKILVDNYKVGGIIPRYKTENGEYISAFYPIKNNSKEVVGIIEADIEFSGFKRQVFNQYFKQAIISILVIFIIAFILIYYSFKILKQEKLIKDQIITKNAIIEHKNKEIFDSIQYAKHIQEAHLPAIDYIQKFLPNSFILYKPKDIISGDFYWFKKCKDIIYIIVSDCTGHGIPGALMSMIGHSKLNSIVTEDTTKSPNQILEELDNSITETLSSKNYSVASNNGMDIAICAINFKKNQLEFSGALQSLIIIKDDNLIEIKGNKYPIGGGGLYKKSAFVTHKFGLDEIDCIYMFSDGYCDQFGGENGKKFKRKKLKELFISLNNLSADKQKYHLVNILDEWRKDIAQTDDILVFGAKL
ncbi:MAG TPA: hypothetical protein EYG85_03480 [Crocinitomix sp.]|nr:hypothetical protein [Crocinitomix sp.]